jgi:hypothetical protein
MIAAVCAGIPGLIAAVYSAKARNENTSQHGEVQTKLEGVQEAVVSHGVVLAEIKGDVQAIATKVDAHAETLARQDERLTRHERDEVPRLGLTGTDGQGPHPVL